MYYKNIVRFSCVLFLLLLERGVIVLAERNDIWYLKICLRQAQREVRITYNLLASARESTSRVRSGDKVKDEITRMSRNPKRRRAQLRAIDELYAAIKKLEACQTVFDNAQSRYYAIKWEFDRHILWFSGLLDQYYDNYFIETPYNGHTIDISFGGDGEPVGLNHGHYILDLQSWSFTCYRKVGEPHYHKNPIILDLELSYG